MGMGCGISVIKYILFVFNLICAVSRNQKKHNYVFWYSILIRWTFAECTFFTDGEKQKRMHMHFDINCTNNNHDDTNTKEIGFVFCVVRFPSGYCPERDRCNCDFSKYAAASIIALEMFCLSYIVNSRELCAHLNRSRFQSLKFIRNVLRIT